MKYICHINKNIKLFMFVLLNMLLIVGCDKANDAYIDPVSGEYCVLSSYDLSNGNEFKVPEDIHLYFYKDSSIIFGNLFKNINYATRKVKLSSYSIYNNISLDNVINAKDAPEYITVVNIIKLGENIGEFIKTDDADYFIYQNYIYKIKLKNKIDEQLFETAKTNRKLYTVKPLYKPLKTTGAFIGLRDDSKKIPKYYTLYVYSDYNSMSVHFIDKLIIPKLNGYLSVNNYNEITGGSYKNLLTFNFSQDFIDEHQNLKIFNSYFNYEDIKIKYASPYIISLSVRNKNFLNNTYKERYETYSLEKDGIRTRLNASDIIGENWLDVIKDNIYIDYLNDVDYRIMPNNIGIVRRNGYWILKTNLFSDSTSDDIYTRIKPVYLKQDSNRIFMTMEQIKELYTSAIDYTVSPQKSLLIVNTGSNIKVVSLYTSNTKVRDSFSMINDNLNLIMDYWVVGSEAEMHLYNINHSNKWTKIY